MKRLHLTQPTIVLMIGVPGAGKSFFARQFADVYGLPRISSDRIRFELFNEPQYTPGEQDIIHRMGDVITDELLRSGGTFVIDGLAANVRTQRLSLERRAREHGYKILSVWVQVDQTTALNRSNKRNPANRDDKYNKPLPEAAFKALSKQLTPLTTEPHVVVSGKHTFPAQHKMVLRTLLPETQPQVPPETPRHDQPAQELHGQPQHHEATKVVAPTPTRPMGKPTPRPENRRITIS